MDSQVLFGIMESSAISENRDLPTTAQSTHLSESRLLSSADANSSSSKAARNEDTEMLSLLSNALESNQWEEVKYILDDLTVITSNDAGEHAEFLDLHAALIQGPSFNLFFNRLPDELNKVFEISYPMIKVSQLQKEILL